MTTIESINADMYQTIADDANITVIEKQVGRTTFEDISEALDEYARLFKAGIASDAEILTLSRAYPNSKRYTEAASRIAEEPIVVGGPASVELIDREGHLITTNALNKAFKKYMSNFRTRNTMVLHSDVQVGWALPAYISKAGQTFKSGVDEKGLFFVTEIRNDTKIANKVLDQINDGKLKSYSIAGSATKTQNMQKGLMPYMLVDELELAEVTVCEKGVNQAAGFDILKGHDSATHSCSDGSCLAHLEKQETSEKLPLELVFKEGGDIDFISSFRVWLNKTDNLALKQKKVFEQVTRDYNKSIIKEDIMNSGKSFHTLNNFEGRDAEHHQLLREYGFPSEQPQDGMRYTPVIETETDEHGMPIHPKPPWYVNEAGQHLGDRLDETLHTYDITKADEDDEDDSRWVSEWQAPQIEKDANIVMADATPSTPSMGWFDMIKGANEQEHLSQFLTWMQKDMDAITAHAMDNAYPGWREDKGAYKIEWGKMKSNIQEGYK